MQEASYRKLLDSLNNLEAAMSKLEDALAIPNDRELVVEGTIQRFEVTIELMWKTLKRALRYEGERVEFARETMRAAYAAGWLHDEDLWIELLNYRNETSHEYLDDIEARYDDIRDAAPELRATTDFLRTRYPGNS